MDNKISAVLTQIEALNEENNFWIVARETARFLATLVEYLKPKNILEIGTSVGYSTIWMASSLSGENKLYTIESNDERFVMAKIHFEKAGLTDKIIQIKGHAPEVMSKSKKFDLVFLDATKYEYISYFEAILPLLNKGAVVIADNINSHSKELNDYVSFTENLPKTNSFKLNLGDGILVSVAGNSA